ncbi:jg13589 [Pararge aegeria aegeria]|uniref:Jg13589 protein n=1 Tax=Pararge aegeria aegeria TaxID=348720 RepID=A0A8S4QZC0_9NEOP|nr:jg13589 [Pararge aegeria aegeria]
MTSAPFADDMQLLLKQLLINSVLCGAGMVASNCPLLDLNNENNDNDDDEYDDNYDDEYNDNDHDDDDEDDEDDDDDDDDDDNDGDDNEKAKVGLLLHFLRSPTLKRKHFFMVNF